MTPIDKKNELIVNSLVQLQRLTADEAKKIALLVATEMINEVEILRIEDIELEEEMITWAEKETREIYELVKELI